MAATGEVLRGDTEWKGIHRRLLIEDICSDLVRHLHADATDGSPRVTVQRERQLGDSTAFADLYVQPDREPAYFVEVKTGYPVDIIVQHLGRKYGPLAAPNDARRLVLVVDTHAYPDWGSAERRIRGALAPGLDLEVWDDQTLAALMREVFGVELGDQADEAELVRVRNQIDQAKAVIAFGDVASDPAEIFRRHSLLWHLDAWRLRRLHRALGAGRVDVLPSATYPQVVVLLADLCSFSAYVRDTRDDEVVRANLSRFYSKTRYEIVNAGGMLYQFAGDEVAAFFGIPDQEPGYIEAALRTARAIVQIGRSVSQSWQRNIDHMQDKSGVHVGMAIGQIQLVAYRPFDRARIGAVGTPMNTAARLMIAAGPSQIVLSNVLRQSLPDSLEADELDPVAAHNIGTVQAWKINS
jgi:adenylate cyclase